MGILEVTFDLINTWTQGEYGNVVKLLLITLLIVIYAVFIFYLYRFAARKNILELNLRQYYSAGPLVKIIPVFLYVIEYIIILPIVTFFWFAAFSVLIFLLASNLPLETVLFISAALIASVRVTSYVSENLSQDLAKMLPLTLLGIALTNPTFFSLSDRLSKIYELPTLFNDVISFLVFIIAVELIMRVFDLGMKISSASKALKAETAVEGPAE